MNEDQARFVSADVAAEALGVAVPTLYAYVGRKGIRTQRAPGSRQTRYWWPDVERVRRKEPASNTRAGVTHETAITLMTQRGPHYRGTSAIELAQSHTFEAVAALLWDVEQEDAFGKGAFAIPKEYPILRKMLRNAGAVDLATVLFPFVEQANPRSFDFSRTGMARTGAELLRWFACIIAGNSKPNTAPIHETLARAFNVSGELADLVRSALVLSADHGFEAATYSVRACATAGVTPYRSVLTGLTVVTGRRSISVRTGTVAELIREILSEIDPQRPIIRRIKDGSKIPGFGSSYYTAGDPRARYLIDRCGEIFGTEKQFKNLKKAIACVKDICNLEPDFVFANAYVFSRLGIDAGRSLFPLGRSAGWIAHAIEQFEAGEVMRAPEFYIGRLPL